jgi:hypothetical protein
MLVIRLLVIVLRIEQSNVFVRAALCDGDGDGVCVCVCGGGGVDKTSSINHTKAMGK